MATRPVIPRSASTKAMMRRKDASVASVFNSLMRLETIVRNLSQSGRDKWKIALVEADIPGSITRDTELAAAIAALNLATGTYTPTLTSVTNLTASTSYTAMYTRNDAFVTVAGRVDVDPTAAGQTQLGISLPIASNIGNPENVAGIAFCPTVSGQGAAIYGDDVNDRATLEWVAVDLANRPFYFQFMYRLF